MISICLKWNRSSKIMNYERLLILSYQWTYECSETTDDFKYMTKSGGMNSVSKTCSSGETLQLDDCIG